MFVTYDVHTLNHVTEFSALSAELHSCYLNCSAGSYRSVAKAMKRRVTHYPLRSVSGLRLIYGINHDELSYG